MNRDELLRHIGSASRQALSAFGEIREIRLFGSLAGGRETGSSDVDLLVVVSSDDCLQLIERSRRYFWFFTDRIGLAVDVISVPVDRLDEYSSILKGSLMMAEREKPEDKPE